MVMDITTQSMIDNIGNQSFIDKAGSQPFGHVVSGYINEYFQKIDKNASVKDVYEMVIAEVERPLLESVMRYVNGNQSKAAIMLGISRGTLRKKLKIHGLLA